MKKIFFYLSLIVSGLSFPQQGVINGDFEYGTTGWTIWSKSGQGLIGTSTFFSSSAISPTVYPKSGEYMARLGGFGYDESELSQNITLPNSTPLFFSFFYQTRSFTGAECSGLNHGGQVRIYIAGQLMYDGYLCYYNELHQWTNVYFDVSAAAGQTIQIILRVDAANTMWSYIYLDDIQIKSTVPVRDEKEDIPFDAELVQNYPNPFNPATIINYSVPETGQVTLKIYDLLGNETAILVNEEKEPGKYKVNFDAGSLPSGVYIYHLVTSGASIKKKMCLIK